MEVVCWLGMIIVWGLLRCLFVLIVAFMLLLKHMLGFLVYR